MKRILLFLATNLAVMVVLSVVVHLLGVDRYLTAQGIDYRALLVFSAVIGFAGSIISLLMSKWMAKMSTGARVIDGSEGSTEYWLVQTVHRLADKAGIGHPEVAIYEGEPNAFATGAFKNEALVAVSTGLLQGMSREQVEAVLGHEISHVANGDMVTLTLIQGVLNTFVIFLSRVIGMLIDNMKMVRTMLDAMKGIEISHLVNISSDAVYGDEPVPLTEGAPTAPGSLHGAMHLAREIAFASSGIAPLAILRPTLVYGDADPHNGYGPNRFIRQSRAGEPIALFGNGEERRDHVSVDDVAEIVARVVLRRSVGTLNVASGEVYSFADAANLAIAATGSK